MQKDKFINIASVIARISVVMLIISIPISVSQKDIRYLSVGIMVFSFLYFGFMVALFGRMMSDFLDGLATLLLLGIGLFAFFYGVSLFMWHYDNRVLLDYYIKFGHFVDRIIK